MGETRAAMPAHTAPMADMDMAWDAGAAVKAADGAAALRRMHAWMNPDGDPEAKGSYKLPHHTADGRVVWRGVAAAMAALMGGRGGVDIPSADRAGVHAHLARHYGQFEKEPPPMRSAGDGIERRSYAAELRVVDPEDDAGLKLRGYAALFDTLSEPLPFGRERILAGAFSKSLRGKPDIRALFDHNTAYVLGRTASKTLALREDDRGLEVEIDPPDTQWARDLSVSVRRGDVNQMSFGFVPLKDRWTDESGQTIRELLEVRLLEVSVVAMPAYHQTSVAVRSTLTEDGLDLDEWASAYARLRAGEQREGDIETIEAFSRACGAVLPQPDTGWQTTSSVRARWLILNRTW